MSCLICNLLKRLDGSLAFSIGEYQEQTCYLFYSFLLKLVDVLVDVKSI